MNKEDFWNSLTQEQKDSFHRTMSRADDLGYDYVVIDAIDIWYAIAKAIRPDKPDQE